MGIFLIGFKRVVGNGLLLCAQIYDMLLKFQIYLLKANILEFWFEVLYFHMLFSEISSQGSVVFLFMAGLLEFIEK